MRGWIAQITCTSPASLNVTSVDVPGACDPRLNSLPLLADMMLWGTLSSLKKVSASPFLMVTLSAEKARPCWWITWVAAKAPTDRPAAMTMVNRCNGRMIKSLGVGMRASARQNRYTRRAEIAVKGLQERNQIGLLLRGKAE